MGVPTRMADYGIQRDAVEALLAQLQANHVVKIGERGDITPEVVRQILTAAL